MLRVLNWKEYLLISFALLIVNLIPWVDPVLKFIWGTLFLVFHSLIFGNWLFIKSPSVYKFFIGLLFISALAGLIGTISFYLFYLNNNTFTLTLLLISLIGLFLIKQKPLVIEKIPRNEYNINPKIFLLTLAYLTIIGFIFYLLWQSRTSNSLRSPWEVVSPKIFFLFFLSTFCLYTISLFSQSKKLLPLLIIHYLTAFSVAVIVYQIGFDYDPFIHRTNEQLILQNGTLSPKPFYYIGQYSLVIFLHKLIGFSLEWLDKLLVPIMAAIYLPMLIFYAFIDNFKVSAKTLFIIILTILGLTFGTFISTTPQSLANLAVLITIFLSLYFLEHPQKAFWPLIIISLFAFSVHPLAGIPCLFFVVLILIYHHFQKKHQLPKIIHLGIFWELAVLACLALPGAFIVNSLTSSQLKVQIAENLLTNFNQIFSGGAGLIFFRPFISLPDLIYTYGNNLWLFFLILALAGLIYLIKNKKFKDFLVYPLLAVILLINYLIISVGFSFFSLISNEQQTYAKRILEMSAYFLLPFAIISLYLFWIKVLAQKRLFILLTIILLSLVLTFAFYLSYPRVDKISLSHGYSTSLTDLKTVNFIDQQNNNQPYIVLSAQTVSAAAIKELGFKKYYQDYFFYPVPTGGRLYQLFEDLAYSRTKTEDVISTARYLTGVNTVYFVLNDYWSDSKNKIVEQKNKADAWFEIDAKNYIFKYTSQFN
jgi:hypothetical protein